MASKMTMEEAKETRQKVTTKMDFLNQSLGECFGAFGLTLAVANLGSFGIQLISIQNAEPYATQLLLPLALPFFPNQRPRLKWLDIRPADLGS